MAHTKHYRLIGKGTYSLTEAQRLTGVSRHTIRRWTQGYSYTYNGEKRSSGPIIATSTPKVDGTPTLNFADLLEVRFLDAFRAYGVSTRTIRVASERARELIGRPRPFSTRIFKTDGRTILAELLRGSDEKSLLDLVQDQYEFERIVDPFLYEGIEFNKLQEPERWWPLGEDRCVVIDPDRCFGAPIVHPWSVMTSILASAVRVEESRTLVAGWYSVSEDAVGDAVEFEAGLSA